MALSPNLKNAIAGTAASPHDHLGYTAAQLGIDDLLASITASDGAPLVAEQVAQIDSKDMSFAVWRNLALRCSHGLGQADVAGLVPRDSDQLAYVTQTTLSVDDTADIVAALQARFPKIAAPHKEDICYATTNRQFAVKAIAERCDAMLVVGAPNSSNSMRLVEVARTAGCSRAVLVQRASELDLASLDGVQTLGLTAGASAPEELVAEVVAALRTRFDVVVEDVVTAQENVAFNVPRVLREGVPVAG